MLITSGMVQVEERLGDGAGGDGSGGDEGSLSSPCREQVGKLLPRLQIAEIRQITPFSIVLDICMHSVY